MFDLIGLLGQYVCFFILHVCGAGQFPKPLSEKQEREYLRRFKNGDMTARNVLVEHNLRLVAHIIKKYYGKQNEQDDLVSIGTIGLIKAIDTFDPDKNIRLSSYASRCIENEILMHFRAAKKTAQDISLNETIDTDKDGNPLTLLDIMAVDDRILDDLDCKLNKQKLGKFISEELTEREKTVIVLRYGLNGQEPMTQKSVAKLLGISRSYVSRIETKALKQLRRRFETSSNLPVAGGILTACKTEGAQIRFGDRLLGRCGLSEDRGAALPDSAENHLVGHALHAEQALLAGVRLALFFSPDLRHITVLYLLRRHHAAQKVADNKACAVAVGQHQNTVFGGDSADKRLLFTVGKHAEATRFDNHRVHQAAELDFVVASLHNNCLAHRQHQRFPSLASSRRRAVSCSKNRRGFTVTDFIFSSASLSASRQLRSASVLTVLVERRARSSAKARFL